MSSYHGKQNGVNISFKFDFPLKFFGKFRCTSVVEYMVVVRILLLDIQQYFRIQEEDQIIPEDFGAGLENISISPKNLPENLDKKYTADWCTKFRIQNSNSYMWTQ